MTDSPEHDPPLTPTQEAAVRRALAEAGGPEPLPGEVADRLDRVIAGLASERAGSTTAVAAAVHPDERGVVVSLDPAARRRRARVRLLLGAAAVVVAGGVGYGIVNDTGTSEDMSAAGMAEGDPTRSSEPEDAGAPAPGEDAEADGGAVEDREDAPSVNNSISPRRFVTDEPLREVRPDRLRDDLVAIQEASLPHPATADYSRTTLTAPASFMCEEADYGTGFLVGIEYRASPALVAFREPVGTSQVAEVLACGTGDVLHSTTLSATD